jgi:hypothetical protein
MRVAARFAQLEKKFNVAEQQQQQLTQPRGVEKRRLCGGKAGESSTL